MLRICDLSSLVSKFCQYQLRLHSKYEQEEAQTEVSQHVSAFKNTANNQHSK